MKNAKILILIMLGLLATSCRSSKPIQTDKYVLNFERDEVWVLTSMRQKEIDYKEDQSPITLQFNPEAQTFAGFAGCNRYFGDYSYTPTSDVEGNLSLEHVGCTMMSCPDPVMRLEDQFLPLINKTNSCKITKYRLTLMQGSKVLLEFEKQ